MNFGSKHPLVAIPFKIPAKFLSENILAALSRSDNSVKGDVEPILVGDFLREVQDQFTGRRLQALWLEELEQRKQKTQNSKTLVLLKVVEDELQGAIVGEGNWTNNPEANKVFIPKRSRLAPSGETPIRGAHGREKNLSSRNNIRALLHCQ